MEDWKYIPGFPNYMVSIDGRVRRVRSWPGGKDKELTPIRSGGGSAYNGYHISFQGKSKFVLAHVLVLEAFVGPRPAGFHACHNDGNPKNNHLDNLRWDTPKGNQADRKLHGTLFCGEANHNAKLTSERVREIRTQFEAGLSAREIAENHNVSCDTIYGIIKRRTWKHI